MADVDLSQYGTVDTSGVDLSQYGTVEKAPEQPGGFSRFMSSVGDQISGLNPLPAIKEWAGNQSKAMDAISVLDRVHQQAAAMPENKGKPPNQWKSPPISPDDQAILDRSNQTDLGHAEGQHPMLAPAVQAGGQAHSGDFAGAAGTLVGGYAVPAVAGMAMEHIPGAIAKGARAVHEAVSKPGTGKMVAGAGQVVGGAGISLSHPFLGPVEMGRGVQTFREGMAARRAAQLGKATTDARPVGPPAPVPAAEMRTPQAPEPMPAAAPPGADTGYEPVSPAPPDPNQFRGPSSVDQSSPAYAGTPPVEAPPQAGPMQQSGPGPASASPAPGGQPSGPQPNPVNWPTMPAMDSEPVRSNAQSRAPRAAKPAASSEPAPAPAAASAPQSPAATPGPPSTPEAPPTPTPLKNPKAQAIAQQLADEMQKNNEAASPSNGRPPEDTKLESVAYQLLRRKIKSQKMAEVLHQGGVSSDDAAQMHDPHWKMVTDAVGRIDGEAVHVPSAETKADTLTHMRKLEKARDIAGQLQTQMAAQ